MTTENKKLNIIMIGQKNVPSRDGGIDVVVGELAPEIAKKGHAVTLLNRKRKKEKGLPILKEYKGCSLDECFTINKRAFDALVHSYFATKRAIKLGKKGKVDIVHYHAEGPCFFLYKFPKKEKRNYKIVVTIHGIDSKRAKWKGFGSKVLEICEKRIVKYADEIIVLSKKDHDFLLKTYGRESTIIPNAVSTPEFLAPNTIEKKWGLKEKDYLLTLARFVPEKGLHYLIEAFLNATKTTGSNKKLVLSGNLSFDKNYYEKIVNMCKGKDNIILTGFVDGETVKELYSNAYLYVLPSELEGMSMSLLEACAYKLPCLISNIEENIAVTGENVYTFETKNVESLTRVLIDLLKGKKSLLVSNKKFFTWGEIAKKTIELYER
ncbi:MAG: glycosyltransferase family 4 protein [Clostridia bacterium]|nr:glycosyltransferase family 4 protein [Clostridia bacterium]